MDYLTGHSWPLVTWPRSCPVRLLPVLHWTGKQRAACEDWPRLHPYEGRQHMSTDTDLDPVETLHNSDWEDLADVDHVEEWEDLAVSARSELEKVVQVVGQIKSEDPAFHAFATMAITVYVLTATEAIWDAVNQRRAAAAGDAALHVGGSA